MRLGCSAIGLTIYPGSQARGEMYEDVLRLGREAREAGLGLVVWSYPRGAGLSKKGETALDVVAYAWHRLPLNWEHILLKSNLLNLILKNRLTFTAG